MHERIHVQKHIGKVRVCPVAFNALATVTELPPKPYETFCAAQKEREGKSLTITPKHGVTEGCMAHAINHTCNPGFANFRFVHAGIVGGWSKDEQGGIGGRRTSEVFVKTTRRVESDAELFANYGTKFRFAGVCVCAIRVDRLNRRIVLL